jgi:hypothetical protein
MHPSYAQLVDKSRAVHEAGRSTRDITPRDIALARLYSYAFRSQTIGAFHATRVALAGLPTANPPALAARERSSLLLLDLADRAMDPIATDARAVLSTFHRYDRDIRSVIEALCQDPANCQIAKNFVQIVEGITRTNGIHLTRDNEALEQASFVVPNLGITIVPLVYGDFHSWNLAFLAPGASHVPRHLHREGVEIHLGYSPLHGSTILGHCRAELHEGYAMPIPSGTAHGYVNQSDHVHHVPFIYGSLKAGGWGVFLDVEPQPFRWEELESVPLETPSMNGSIHLEREIAKAEELPPGERRTLIPATATDCGGCGGLELSITRIDEAGLSFASDCFRIVSVVRGAGAVQLAGASAKIRVTRPFRDSGPNRGPSSPDKCRPDGDS